jgi:hypothetical protein
MESKGLLFIPDISGFTRFVNETEIEHTSLIIQELLESLLNSNELGLDVSEIEGDAILFYKYGEPPAFKELYQQVEKMFRNFHSHLKAYDMQRFCQCNACNSAIELTLKVITHYGEFTGYHVKNFNKLIGKDIIVAHQLLKNDIKQHEYWLVTNSLAKEETLTDLTTWMKWVASYKEMEGGQIAFHYTQLGELKNTLPPAVVPDFDLSGKVSMITSSKEYETDINTLFHLAGDFNYRSRWRQGVKSVQKLDHILPRIGMRYRCDTEKGESVIYSSSYNYYPERTEFSETEEKSDSTMYYIVEKVDEKKSRLTLNFYLKKNIINQFIFILTQKVKMKTDLEQSLANIDRLMQEISLSAEA